MYAKFYCLKKNNVEQCVMYHVEFETLLSGNRTGSVVFINNIQQQRKRQAVNKSS